MTIYSEDYLKPDWNTLINEYHKVSNYIWSNNLQSNYFSKLEKEFMGKVERNKPNEAQKVLYKLQDYEKSNKLKQ